MRCSLLALSSYIDAELDPDHAGEVDAHVIGCERCRMALDYLREETHRISSLARVHVPEDAVHELFAQVGFIDPDEELPGAPPQRQTAVAERESLPWLSGDRGKALPWNPRQPGTTEFGTPAHRGAGVAVAEHPPGPGLWDIAASRIPVSEMLEPELALDVPDVAAPEVGIEPPEASTAPPDAAVPPAAGIVERAPDIEAVIPPLVEPEVEIIGIAPPTLSPHPLVPSAPPAAPGPPPEPMPPQLAPAAPRSPFQRVREAIAVQIALRRGAGRDLDDSVEIVSGAGAPEWAERPRPRMPRERMPVAPPVLPAPPTAEIARAETASLEATPVVNARPAEVTVPEPPLAHPPVPRPGAGRHVRSLKSHRPDPRAWKPTAPVTAQRRVLAHGPAVGAADRDQRLWVFAGAALVVMLIGLLIGKQVTTTAPLAAAQRPHATPIAGHGSPPITVAPPATAPASTQPASTPLQLTGATTLGNGAAGYSIADVRYGPHPGIFRVVFDLAGPASSNAPTAVLGFGNPTTLYVEFSGVGPAGTLASPPSGYVVTSLQPYPTGRNSGKTIFVITLSRAATLNAYYLAGQRLVIDIS